MNQKQDHMRTMLIGFALCFMILFRLIPPFPGLNDGGMAVLGLFLGVLILWLFVAIDWPSLLLIGALMTVPGLTGKAIFSASFGSPTVIFLIFTFVLTDALAKTGILRRIAVSFMTSRLAQRGPWHFVALYFASILFLGSFISPTVLFFLYLPMLEEICSILSLEKGNKNAAMLMMGTVIMTGISSGMTPIAHVFPLIAINAYEAFAKTTVSTLSYLGLAIPVGLLTALLVVVVFRFLLRPPVSEMHMERAMEIEKRLLSSGQENAVQPGTKRVIAVFFFVIFLWITPGLLSGMLPKGGVKTALMALSKLGTAFPPILGCVLLSIFTEKGEPLLHLGKALKEGVAWSAILMCAGTGAIGWALTQKSVGVMAWVSAHVAPIAVSFSPVMLFLFFALWSALQTNLSSNMVTATVVSAAALAMVSQLGGVHPALLLSSIGMLSAYAFATPPAMPCVAIAGSSGWTNMRQMMLYGFLAMLVAVFVTTAWGMSVGSALF